MKNLRHLTLALLTIFTVSTFTGCSSSDPDFAVYPRDAYIIQKGSLATVPTFVIWSGWQGAYQSLTSATMTTSNSLPVSKNGVYISNAFEAEVTSTALESLNGYYTVNAKADNGEEASNAFTVSGLTEKHTLGDFVITELSYNNGSLSYKVETPVENATNYGFMITDMGSDIESIIISGSRVFDVFTHQTQVGTTENQEVTVRFESSGIQYERARIVPAVFNTNVNNVRFVVYLDEANTRYIAKGANEFTATPVGE